MLEGHANLYRRHIILRMLTTTLHVEDYLGSHTTAFGLD